MNKFILLLLGCILACSPKQKINKQHSHKHQNGERKSRPQEPIAEAKLPEHTVSINDIVFKTIDDKELKLDIHQPKKGIKNAPLVVWVHGGAWKRGDKQAFLHKNNHLVNTLLNNGYMVASVNYRLSGEATFPAQIQDCNDAINFLVKNSTKYGFDKNRIAITGRSAGGHLAELIATSKNHQIEDFFTTTNQPDFEIKALVSFFGVSDFATFKDKEKRSSDKSPEAKLLGGAPNIKKELAKKASPSTYVNQNTPPTLLLHGTNDQNVPHQQSEFLHQLLNKNSVINELYLAENARHGDPVFDTDKYVTLVRQFLEQHL